METIEAKDMIKMAVDIVNRKYPKDQERDDLVANAVLGMLECQRKFDPSKGSKMSTYCYMSGWRSIQNYLRRSARSRAMPKINNLESIEENLHVGDDDGHSLERQVADKDSFASIIDKAHKYLTPKQLRVFTMHHAQSRTMRSIANELEVSYQDIGLTYTNALRKIRRAINAQPL